MLLILRLFLILEIFKDLEILEIFYFVMWIFSNVDSSIVLCV